MAWFGIDLPGIVGDVLDEVAKDATLIVVTLGARKATSTAGLTITKTNVACRGYIADFEEHQIDGALVTRQDRLVVLFASSLGTTVPKERDEVTIEGDTYKIHRVTRDPASAEYQLTVRLGG